MMDHMKDTLSSEWEVSNLGDPHKIVGIKVMCTDNSMSISQQKYIENLLCKEDMLDVNPIAVPMNLAIHMLNYWGVYNSSQIPQDQISAMQSKN